MMLQHPSPSRDAIPGWETELFVLRGEDRDQLRTRIDDLARFAASNAHLALADASYTLNAGLAPGGVRLAIIAKSWDDLRAKLARAAAKLADPGCEKIRDVTGLYYFAAPFPPQGKLAFLFPGEGAQYLHMTGDLLPHFPQLEAVLAYCDEIAARPGRKIPSPRRFIQFPRDAAPAERDAAERELRRLGNAMFSVLVADLALFHLLESFGLAPDMIAGHSAGELAALMAAGCMSDEHDATERVVETMQALEEMEVETGVEPAMLLAVGAAREKMAALLAEQNTPADEAFVAMDNCPHQTVLVGAARPMAAVEARLKEEGLVFERLSLSRPYHTRLFEPYAAPLAAMVDSIPFQAPRRKIYSCTTAQPFPDDPAEIRRLTLAHWFSPVEFAQMIRNLHADGARLFVEVGPRGNLTSFVEDILRGKPFLALPADVPRRNGVTQLHHLLGQLAAHGVPLKLEELYARRGVKQIADCGLRIADWEGSKSQDDGVALEPLAGACAESAGALTMAERGAVVASHWTLMERFLDDQEAIVQAYLAGRRRGGRRVARTGAAAGNFPTPAMRPATGNAGAPEAFGFPRDDDRAANPQSAIPTPPCSALPLLGEIVKHEPGCEVVVRRRLDLAEDRFAADHTVGGRMVSKVHPDHCGLPIGPMTFTLELMAETATVLAPGRVPIEVKDVRLFRWLAYYKEAPGEIEATARVVAPLPPASPSDGVPQPAATGSAIEVEVRIAIVDNGHLPPGEKDGPAAVGRVVLAPSYPEAPPAGLSELTSRRPCRISLEGLYHDLFHGALLMGVTALNDIGDQGIEAQAVVLPRRGLFASTDDPQFLLDPVLLDVAMHPLCAWHLEQPNLDGRTLLPFEVKSVKVFGPRPAEGARFAVRGRVVESSPRHFVHTVEAIDETGRVWCRLDSAKYWRFYMPYGEVKFHGRKDEYFISVPWPEAIASRGKDTPRTTNGQGGGAGEPRAVCVRLEPPIDLLQPAMQVVMAQVTLSDDEMREYLRMTAPAKKRFDWAFGRLAAKDAVRLMWWRRHGERMYPADMELRHDEHGRPFAVHLGDREAATMPHVSVSHAEGIMAAISSFEPHVGIDLEKIEPREASFEAVAFDPAERRLLDEQPDRAEAVTRFWCAKEAVAKALGRGLSEGPRSVAVRSCAAGGIGVELGAALAAEFPQFAGRPLHVATQRYKSFIVATTFCDGA